GVPTAYAGSSGEIAAVRLERWGGLLVGPVADASPPSGPPCAAWCGGRETPGDLSHREAWSALLPLLSAYGVSGPEDAVRRAVLAQLPATARAVAFRDVSGNLILPLGEGRPGRLFVAHLDEIGYRITALDADGRARVERQGGFYDWLYEGERVVVG